MKHETLKKKGKEKSGWLMEKNKVKYVNKYGIEQKNEGSKKIQDIIKANKAKDNINEINKKTSLSNTDKKSLILK